MVVQGIYGTGNPRTIGLDRLIALLTRLKSFEFQNPSADLWNDEPVHASHQTTLSDAPNANHDLLPDLLRSLEESKACMAALNEVWDHLRRRICCLQKACTPFVLEKGIRTLPDEILSDIFEAGHRMTEGWTFAKSFFISLGHIGSRSIDRRRHRKRNDTTLPPNLVHRWSRLQIYSAVANHLIEEGGFTSFPRLLYLCNAWNTTIKMSKHTLPLLFSHSKRIKVPSDYIFLAQLTSLELLHDDTAVDVAPLMRALHSLKNLKILSLTFDGCSEVDDPQEIIDMLGNHSVAIDTLQIAILNGTSPDLIISLYKGLQYLSPSAVHIHMEDIDDEEHDLEEFFFTLPEDSFPYGSTITIHASRTKEINLAWWPGPILTGIVERCQIAHTVHFDGPTVSFIKSGSTDWRRFASLRHVRFKSCDHLTEPEVDDLARNLMCGKAEGAGLQTLEIFSCRMISEEFLVELGDAVGPKLKWKMCDCD
ncbi:hypothetical protein BD410DRAFT_804159 [Rickenella mellea]|uniref:F-box domain-containing protein n=1 Tax=Rickenella mellea TaxID=50990 RepID=A0A4Y7Q3W7_9AGAM|nr:hypothetical protein BD410DRAFT_804159 [Rickenella mellea]